jgi:hypothetical protein
MILTCTKCKEVKDSSLFHRYDKKKNGFTSQCKQCRNEKRKTFYWSNPEKERNKTQKYRKHLRETDPQKLFLSNRNTKLKQAYGIDLEQYDKMLKAQACKCAVCGKEHVEEEKKRLVVDHCHDSEQIRELLCNNCNTALGLLKEDIQVIDKLKDYIIKHQTI